MPQHNRECFLAGASLCAARVGAVRRGTHVIVPCTSLCHLTSKSFTGPALGLGVGESAASGGCSTAEDAPSVLAACAVLGLNTVHGTQPCLSPIAAGRRGRASVRLGRSVRAGFVVVRSYRGSKSNERCAVFTHAHAHTSLAARSLTHAYSGPDGNVPRGRDPRGCIELAIGTFDWCVDIWVRFW